MVKMTKCLLVAVACVTAMLLAGCGDPAPPAEGQGPSDQIMQANGPNPSNPQLGGESGGTGSTGGTTATPGQQPAQPGSTGH